MNNKYEVVVSEREDSLRVKVTICDDQGEPSRVIWVNTTNDDEDSTSEALYYAARRILELEEKLGNGA